MLNTKDLFNTKITLRLKINADMLYRRAVRAHPEAEGLLGPSTDLRVRQAIGTALHAPAAAVNDPPHHQKREQRGKMAHPALLTSVVDRTGVAG